MTDSRPPFNESESPSPTPPPSRDRLDGEEWIAIGITFITLGSIFLWILNSQDNQVFVRNRWINLFPSATVSPQSPLNQADSSPEAALIPQETLSAEKDNIPEAISPLPRSSPVVVAPVPVTSSQSIPEHWSQPFAQQLLEKGYLEAEITRNWQPNREITRAELASQIAEVFDAREATQAAKNFPDLPSEESSQQKINRAVELGFMEGYAEGTFRPEQKITRLEVLVALATGLKLTPPNPDKATEIVKIYQDYQALPPWAVAKIAAATQSHLVVGYPDKTRLNPLKPVTQAEAIALLHQALVVSGQLPEVDSPYIVHAE